MQTVVHLERIADSAVDIARVVMRAVGAGAGAPDPRTVAGLGDMSLKVTAMLDHALRAFKERSRELCLAVAAMEADLDGVYEGLVDRFATATRDTDNRIGVLEMDRIARFLQRAGGHAVDIAEAVWFQITGELREFDHDRSPQQQP